MLGGPQNGQSEPQNLTTNPPTSQSMAMLANHGTQWHIHPQQQVHMMAYAPPPPHENNDVKKFFQSNPAENNDVKKYFQSPPETNDVNQSGNTNQQPPQSQSSGAPQTPNTPQIQHISADQLNQITSGQLEHSIWSVSSDIGREIEQNYNLEEDNLPHDEEEMLEEPEVKPKIKKEIRKKRKLADLLAEGIDPTKLEDNSDQVRERFSKGCECEGENCFKNMNPEFVFRHRLNIAELTKNEHDMYLMGVTMACLANPEETSRHKERKRLRASYVFQGKKVCLDAFLYLENCTHYQLKAIRKHVMVNGVTPRVHGNHGKKPPNTFPLDTYQHAAAFLTSYIARYTPGQTTPKKQSKSGKSPPVFLPAELTRKKIHSAYKEFCEHFEPEVKVMGYSSFRHFMKEQFPNVKFFRIDKKNEKITHSDDDDDDVETQNGVVQNSVPQQPQHQAPPRQDHRMDAVQLQPHPDPRPPQEKSRVTPPVTTTPSLPPPPPPTSLPPPHPPNSHPVPVSMPHVAISSAYQGYSHVQLPLNLQTQQPLYSACMQPGVFAPPQHPPQVRPTGFPPYTNL